MAAILSRRQWVNIDYAYFEYVLENEQYSQIYH